MTTATTSTRRWSEARSVVAITLALLLPVGVYFRLGFRIDHTARNAFIEACQGENVVRDEFLAFVDSTVQRSESSLRATLAAPSATLDQKLTATRNLAGLRVVSADAHAKAKQLPCAYPPSS